MTVEQQISLEEQINQVETDLFLLKEEKIPDNREIHRLEKKLSELQDKLNEG